MKMLKNGNSKLGEAIYNFNLPRSTCSCRTELCSKYCYAKKGHFRYENVVKCFGNNLVESKQDDFVKRMNAQIIYLDCKYVRLHSSGDFYSQEYYEKWNQIAKANPDVKFLAFTRNITIDFSDRCENFIIYQSTDKTTKKTNPTLSLTANIFDEGEHPNKHMHHVKETDSYVCDSKCYKCKFCWNSKKNVSFKLRK
ncbi:hypothetical protein KY320_01515 [Candidatus Woesearchaeota archaeon]|nr:hypothetical protein [Candidatus Woesearchaeota archaeon]